jgi:hypothetical protein
MSTNCCGTSVPQARSFEALPQAVAVWQERLTAGLSRIVQASDQTLGHLEEEILQRTRDLERVVLEEAAQKQADQAPPVCPVCGGKLSRRTHGHERSYQTRFGGSRSGARGGGVAVVSAGDFQRITCWAWRRRAVVPPGCRRWQPWR